MEPRYETLIVGVITPWEDGWYYRDSYNQIWRLWRDPSPSMPIRYEIKEKLYPPISTLEKISRKEL